MSGMVQGISVSASVFTLVAIAVDRYSGRWPKTRPGKHLGADVPLGRRNPIYADDTDVFACAIIAIKRSILCRFYLSQVLFRS